MKLVAIITLFTVAAFTGNSPAHDSPLRTAHGTVVDPKGEAVAASIVYLHDEHKDLVSAVRRIHAHSTNKLINLDLKIVRKKPFVTSSVEHGSLSTIATTPNDRSTKGIRSHVPIAVASTL